MGGDWEQPRRVRARQGGLLAIRDPKGRSRCTFILVQRGRRSLAPPGSVSVLHALLRLCRRCAGAATPAPIAPVIDAAPVNVDAVAYPAAVPLRRLGGAARRGRGAAPASAASSTAPGPAPGCAASGGISPGPRGRRHARDMAGRASSRISGQAGPRCDAGRGRADGAEAAWVRRSPTAAGPGASPAAIVRSWLDSPPHRAILLSPRLRASGSASPAGRRCPAAAAPPSCWTRGAASRAARPTRSRGSRAPARPRSTRRARPARGRARRVPRRAPSPRTARPPGA